MTEKIEKLFADWMTRDMGDAFIHSIVLEKNSDGTFSQGMTRIKFNAFCAGLQSLPLITGEPVARIEKSATGNDTLFIGWEALCKMPAGTKFYTSPQPSQPITELPKPIFTQVADGIEIGYDLSGGADIRLGGEFTYVKINYSHEYTDNATRTRLAENIVKLIQGEVPQPLQPITADMVTAEMVDDLNKTTHESSSRKEIIAAAYNAVIKGQTK